MRSRAVIAASKSVQTSLFMCLCRLESFLYIRLDCFFQPWYPGSRKRNPRCAVIPVIDLFAGPGGLGEGFSSLVDENGQHIFNIILSVERDEQAHQTLRLRSYARKLIEDEGSLPKIYRSYMLNHTQATLEKLKKHNPECWQKAEEEAICHELKDGDDTIIEIARKRLKKANRAENAPWVLIGGPPCQAYSLVGRSRRAHEKEKLEKDPKQTLYKCYLSFLKALQPTVFVMENVKGLLSATLNGSRVFDLICDDMREAGYEVRSLVTREPASPKDYVVESERFGIPQMRHRVILLGVQKGSQTPTDILVPLEEICLKDVICDIPKVRSGFSERNEGWRDINWAQYINNAARQLLKTKEGEGLRPILGRVIKSRPPKVMQKNKTNGKRSKYHEWYRGQLGKSLALCNHESRSHLAADLDRYMFCAAYAEKHGMPARITEFPDYLYPNHKNVHNLRPGEEMKFDDRFRVQLWERPATTVTSHIAKDGHYFIHPDPEQCRSLTVREAARLQTFPDDYIFEGTRTSQYTQVGNAVPPLLAQQVGAIVARYLGISARSYIQNQESQNR